MPTTSNFGWTTPADTDLVKDGALAIRTLGNGIDTSMAELKGGTTGQVLSKTSNTDMDFTWVTTDDANAIQNAIVDAKGDLIAASAADTPARLAVGNNGETLVANSLASVGLSWQGTYAAGKNFVINGAFDIWQRGTSSGSAGYQTADRWYGNASNTTTFAQETTTIPSDSRFAFKMTAGATAQMWIQQPIETLNAIQLAGKTIAVAADVSASTSTGMTINVYSSTSVDNTAAGSWGSAITPTSGGTGTAVSGSFTRISGTYAIPSTAKSVMIQIITTSTVANGVVVYIGNVQAEIGSVPTAFTRAGGNIAGEYAAACRYYWRAGLDSSGLYGILGNSGYTDSTTNSNVMFNFPVHMRVAPTAIDYPTLSTTRLLNLGNPFVPTAASLNTTNTTADIGWVAFTSSGMTSGQFSQYTRNNSSTAYIGFSAEL